MMIILVPLTRDNAGKSIINIFYIFGDAWKNIPFRKLCIATFLVFNSFQTIAAFSFFIIVHYLFLEMHRAAGIWPAMHGSVGAIVTTFLVIPLVSKMAQSYGKKETFIISQVHINYWICPYFGFYLFPVSHICFCLLCLSSHLELVGYLL